jgi:hypothetical protein
MPITADSPWGILKQYLEIYGLMKYTLPQQELASGAPLKSEIPVAGHTKVGKIWLPKGENYVNLVSYLESNAHNIPIYWAGKWDCQSALIQGVQALGGKFVPNSNYRGRYGKI